MTWQTKSTSSAATEQLGEQLGHRLKGSEVIELVSDLGGGKTTFARGLVHGFGDKSVVTSPSFTLSKVYKAKGLELHHFDFYRLSDAGLFRHELHDLVQDPKSIIVVEWADAVHDVLPRQRLVVHITASGDEQRTISCEFPKELEYLVEDT
jgi:tRNA threonylcarbamoyladenosine biosynthesis protein TsaE